MPAIVHVSLDEYMSTEYEPDCDYVDGTIEERNVGIKRHSPADHNGVTQTPPALCAEILSPDDRWSGVQIRLKDFLDFGVPMIWAVDPYSKQAWIATRNHPAALVERWQTAVPGAEPGIRIE